MRSEGPRPGPSFPHYGKLVGPEKDELYNSIHRVDNVLHSNSVTYAGLKVKPHRCVSRESQELRKATSPTLKSSTC